MGIHDYYKEKYGKESKFLAYGADIHEDYNSEFLKEFGLEENGYYLLVARLEPENNIAMAIDGYLASEENGRRPLVIVGKTNTPHGKELVARYGKERSVRFIGGIYDFKKLNSIRKYLWPIFMGIRQAERTFITGKLICVRLFTLANDNLFNRAVLKHHAEYCSTPGGSNRAVE